MNAQNTGVRIASLLFVGIFSIALCFGLGKFFFKLSQRVCYDMSDLRSSCNGISSECSLVLDVSVREETGELYTKHRYTASFNVYQKRVVYGTKWYFFKNEFREDTWEDLFRWKYGRPWAYGDPEITEQDAMDWFNERHKTKNDSPFGPAWEYPRAVSASYYYQDKVCLDPSPLTDGGTAEILGYVQFPDGTKCSIEKIPSYTIHFTTGVVVVPIRLKPGCAKCRRSR